ncbi:hypothetical protein RD055328_06870 [Companilactobacillus sp. RD055328]|uniref:LapA family protein n=1 Tax=Companilactobacillus sp. RD055328 TaxID=2916634 RepID=UPI001FC8D654|nr:LapA family protein [Companilactobacillus sp. RD055328]GKQ42764.1 hypothetical protein RD055328_06870 [Companilactobacillus sp. RD055328]
MKLMTKKQAKFFLSIVLVLIVVLFSIFNMETITVNFLFAKLQVPLIILIIVTFILGAIASYLFSFSNKKEDKESVPTSKNKNTSENK